MPVTITRTKTDLIGAPASPSAIAAGGSVSGALDMTSPSGVTEASLAVVVVVGVAAPTTNPTVQFAFTEDGTNHVNDGGAIAVPITAASTSYHYRYDPPGSARGARVTITNGATNAITAWAQGGTLAVS